MPLSRSPVPSMTVRTRKRVLSWPAVGTAPLAISRGSTAAWFAVEQEVPKAGIPFG